MQIIKPLFENILIKPIEQKKPEKKGIYIPPLNDEQIEGEVVAIGNGVNLPVVIKGLGGFENLVRSEIAVKVGQHVVYKAFTATPVRINGEKHFLLNQRDVMGIVEYS